MPKTEIDYSNTIIYKITCKDPTIKDVYVGHTTNFVQRKHHHKQSCINPNSPNYKYKLYETIRTTGGWTNWSMEIINFFNCRDHYEARIKEQEYFVLLNATLNSIEPLPKPKEVNQQNIFIEEPATTNIDNPNNKDISIQKDKHYKCQYCNYVTDIKQNINKHMSTSKHSKKIEPVESSKLKCNICNKEYKNRSGLWKHNKTCIENQDNRHHNNNNLTNENMEFKNPAVSTDMIIDFIKQNNELKKMLMDQTNTMIEQNKKIIELSQNNQVINNTTNNQTNTQFNLNLFLNEKCKNAINLVDFVENLKITFDDLENVGNTGYVNGITQIFMNGLKKLDLYTRPVHCTDIKRDTLYIREQNEWIKEDPELQKIKAAIKKIAFKNVQQISAWNNLHPNMQILDSDEFNMAFNIMQESLGGPLGTDVEKKNDKIVKNIAKSVFIDRQMVV